MEKIEENIPASIIVRTCNEGKHIGRLLEGVFFQKADFLFEVIIVDSGSVDNTLEIAGKYPVKVVHILPQDFSFGYSLNAGVKESRGKYLVFISAHCYPINENWLSNIIDPFSKDDKAALVYGKQRGNHLTNFAEKQLFLRTFPDFSNSKQQVPFCNNANCAIRRWLWDKVPYDEELTGLEDLDWAHKVLKRGYHAFYNAEAGIIHVHEESARKIFRRYKREAIALKNIFPETKFTFFEFVKLLTVNLFHDYWAAIRQDRRIKNLWEIFMFRLMQFWGTYRGYKFKEPITSEIKRYFYYPHTIKRHGKEI